MINKKDIRKTPIIRVEWLDAVSGSGWTAIDKVESPAKCLTVGYLIREDKMQVVVAACISTGDSCNSTITIPKGMILKRSKIK